MKFSLIALAGALTTANAASSVVPKTFKINGKRNLRRGDASTVALLQKAVPYNRKNSNRHLQEEDDAAEAEQGEEAANDAAAEEEEAAAGEEEEEAAVEPSSASTISFGKCVDVKTRDDNLFTEDLIEQVQAGNVMSLKSYVIFNVCNDTYGYGCSESNSVEYMVDLATYLSVVGLKQANQRTDYCEQCNRFQDSCAAAAEEEEEEQAAYDEEAVDEEQEGEEEQDGEQADAEEAVDEEQEREEEQGEQEGEEAMDEQEQGEQEQEGSMDQQEQGEQEGEEAMDEQEGSMDQQEQGEQEQGEQEQGEQEFEEQKEEQAAQAYEMANGGRKLKEQINCNKCESLQCFADDAENGEADLDMMVAEWIEEVANCKATDQYVNGMQVYLGPICSDGQYFEIGAFLNEDCTIHTNLASFSEIVAGEQDNYDVDVAGYAISALKAAVYEPMTCESQEFADVNEEEEEEENEENNEMNDYCKQLFEGEQSVKFSDCAAAEEEEQDEEQEEEEADEDYSWYSYDMEEADDIEETCSKVVSFNGEYTRYYDSSVNGTIHENESSVSIFGITAIVVACVAAVGLVASSLTKKKKQSPVLLDEPIYQGGQMS